MAEVTEHEAELDDQPVFWRSAPGGRPPVLYVHGVPTSSDDWIPFLERTGGVAPDLPGFGRSGKRGDLDYTMEGYERFLESFLELAEIDRARLVVHDWGAVGLLWAMRFPRRVERLVVLNSVPFLPGYRWHRVARGWRTPLAGELLMGMTTRRMLSRALRKANASPDSMPGPYTDVVYRHFDQGTQRAILRLYRTSPGQKLAEAGRGLRDIDCPALVVWGDRDRYLPPRFGDGYSAALGDARVVHLPDAGHWPWMDRPVVIDLVAAFLDRGEVPAGFAEAAA
jgi:pimeloyl-ACP methyl ester carboxylesterase